MTTLTQASDQWANRPEDERFASLDSLHAAVTHHRDASVEATGVNLKDMHVEWNMTPPKDPTDTTAKWAERPLLVGESGTQAEFTHYAFGQLARRVGAPAAYLRTLPGSLAAECMNDGIQRMERGTNENLLFTKNGDLRVRAIVSEKYTRIWNNDVTSRLVQLVARNPQWQPAPAAFDGSRGMYASDSDMFAFFVDNDRRIFESLPGGGLGRGFFVWNSEVGAASFGIMTFLYEYVCGNHRVWGAKGVAELRIPHIGNADERAFSRMSVELRKYADSSAADDELKIHAQRTYELGATKDEVLDAVFALNTGLTKGTISAGYTRAVEQEDRYGSPRSVWGFIGGLTEVARDLPYTDERVAVEKASAKIAAIAF